MSEQVLIDMRKRKWKQPSGKDMLAFVWKNTPIVVESTHGVSMLAVGLREVSFRQHQEAMLLRIANNFGVPMELVREMR